MNLENLIDLQDSYWAMFYCAFWHLFNSLTFRCPVLLTKEHGYYHSDELEMGQNTVLTRDESSTKADKAFTEMVDRVVNCLKLVILNTPSLLDPVGAQHVFYGMTNEILTSVSSLADFMCSTDSFLGYCERSSGSAFIHSSNTLHPDVRAYIKSARHMPKIKRGGAAVTSLKQRYGYVHMWMEIRDLVLNLEVIARAAMRLTDLVIDHFPGDVCGYNGEKLFDACREDPFMYGWKLRQSDKVYNKETGGEPFLAYRPFPFLRFTKSLAACTKMHHRDYLPTLFTTHEPALEFEKKGKGEEYRKVWERAFGMKNIDLTKMAFNRIMHELQSDFKPGWVDEIYDQASTDPLPLTPHEVNFYSSLSHRLSIRGSNTIDRKGVDDLHDEFDALVASQDLLLRDQTITKKRKRKKKRKYRPTPEQPTKEKPTEEQPQEEEEEETEKVAPCRSARIIQKWWRDHKLCLREAAVSAKETHWAWLSEIAARIQHIIFNLAYQDPVLLFHMDPCTRAIPMHVLINHPLVTEVCNGQDDPLLVVSHALIGNAPDLLVTHDPRFGFLLVSPLVWGA